jgi:hypothetical protein
LVEQVGSTELLLVTINGCNVTITSAWWLSQTVLLELSFYLKWDLWYIILAKWGPSDWSAYCFALSISDGAFFGNVWHLFGFCAWCRACLSMRSSLFSDLHSICILAFCHTWTSKSYRMVSWCLLWWCLTW